MDGGLEDRPERCREICLVEVFDDALEDGSAAVGTGIHPFRDPTLREELSADRMVVRTAGQAPDYPMQLVIGLFDLPDAPAPASRSPSRS